MYSGSVYTIDLRRIRDAIKDLGWSVGTGNSAVVYPGLPDWVLSVDDDPSDDLMQEYRYRKAAAEADIVNPDGSKAILDGVNSDGIRIGSVHVRLRPTIQTRDLELSVGDAWQPSDSLVSMVDHAGSQVSLDDTAHARVEHNVDTTLPGVYAVRFYHHPSGNAASGGDYETSRAASVTVMGDYRIAYDANGGTGAPATEESRTAAATLETATSSPAGTPRPTGREPPTTRARTSRSPTPTTTSPSMPSGSPSIRTRAPRASRAGRTARPPLRGARRTASVAATPPPRSPARRRPPRGRGPASLKPATPPPMSPSSCSARRFPSSPSAPS